jgi:hypothetical protein
MNVYKEMLRFYCTFINSHMFNLLSLSFMNYLSKEKETERNSIQSIHVNLVRNPVR